MFNASLTSSPGIPTGCDAERRYFPYQCRCAAMLEVTLSYKFDVIQTTAIDI